MAFYCASQDRGFDGLTLGPGEKLGTPLRSAGGELCFIPLSKLRGEAHSIKRGCMYWEVPPNDN